MRFTINRELILGPLTHLNTITDRHQQIPILSHAVLRADAGEIHLTASNITVEITESISVSLETKGEITFPLKDVLEYCRRLPDNSNLEFSTEDEELVINIAPDDQGELEEAAPSGISKLRTVTLRADDYPKLEVSEWGHSFQITRSELREALKRTSFAIGADESRSFFRTMLFEIDSSNLRTVATDAHRLATCETPLTEGPKESTLRVLLPHRAIRDLERLLPDLISEITVSISSNHKHIRINTPKLSYISQLGEGQYPDWRPLIPVNLGNAFVVGRQHLHDVFGRVAILSSKTPVPAKVRLSQGFMRVSATRIEPMLEINEKIPAAIEKGDNYNFQVNSQYVLDIINALFDCQSIKFEYRDDESACLITSPDNDSAQYLLMLMKDS